MIDNEVLKKKIEKDLRPLKLTDDQEDIVIKEINYLSELLIEIYIEKTKNQITNYE